MAEDKKAFLQGKMNKDIDARLLPNGEYRTAQNIQVSTSEAQDVGTVQNIKGNDLIKLFPDLNSSYGVSLSNLETIGCFFDEANNRSFYFITNYTCENSNAGGLVGSPDGPTLAATANTESLSDLFCAILLFTEDEGIKVLCQGLFLNFSKTHEITGVNILNDLLFFTDNFNQPRRISVSRALSDSSFYDTEQKISVAKFAPVFPLRLLNSSNESTMETDDTIESDFLENQFVRFSYRFRYIDGEYSVMAPFTQAVFIPEIYKKTNTGFTLQEVKSVVQTGEVEGMVNCINKATFKLQMPTPSSTAFNDYQIKEVQLLCKVDGDLPVRVLDVISSSTNLIDSSGVLNYTYESSEPFKTLPQNQVTRVFDNVPLKAQSQEIIGNRVVYGNYFEKRSLANSELDFEVNTATKNSSDSSDSDFLHNEYKYHSVKQRRKYQVGIVLSDIFGRQSPVILPKETTLKTSLERASIYVPPKDKELFDSSKWSNYADNSSNTTNWGDVLRIRFDDIIGNAYSATNIYGWYSYRVVVQQQEQEYYNVYTSGVSTTGNFGFFNLEADNVNKVPRDVTDINASDALVGSEAKLYPKIINYNISSPTAEGYAPTSGSLLATGGLISVLSIGTAEEHGISYQSAGVPSMVPGSAGLLIAKIPTIDEDFPSLSRQGGIAVFETEPFDSKIDIFYETSSSGLVNDLNTSIANSQTGLDNVEIEKTNGVEEASLLGTTIGRVVASNSSGQQAATITLLSVAAKKPSEPLDAFETVQTDLISPDDYFELDSSSGQNFIKTKRLFWFNEEGLQFRFKILASFGGTNLERQITTYALQPSDQINETITLQNSLPSLNLSGGGSEINISASASSSTGVIGQMEATNGAADETDDNHKKNLSFRITSELDNSNNSSSNFTINFETGEISINNFASLEVNKTYNVVVAVFETPFFDTSFTTIDTSDAPNAENNPYAVFNLTIKTDSGQSLQEFFRSTIGYPNFLTASSEQADIISFHNGDGFLPQVNDIVYTNRTGTIPLNTEQWHTMSTTLNGTGESFKTDSLGKVIEVSGE